MKLVLVDVFFILKFMEVQVTILWQTMQEIELPAGTKPAILCTGVPKMVLLWEVLGTAACPQLELPLFWPQISNNVSAKCSLNFWERIANHAS